MKSGAFAKYVNKVRKYYKEKYIFTLEEVKKYIPYEFITGEGGLHIFIKLKDGISSREVLNRCYKKGCYSHQAIFSISMEMDSLP